MNSLFPLVRWIPHLVKSFTLPPPKGGVNIVVDPLSDDGSCEEQLCLPTPPSQLIQNNTMRFDTIYFDINYMIVI